jgi:hypothetical protein
MLKKLNNIIVLYSLIMIYFSCKNHLKQTSIRYTEQGYEEGVIKDDSNIAGCGYSILLANEQLITPQNLPDNFKKDNLKVWVKYTVLPKQPITNCMRGKVVNIIAIEKK